jgi:hypothetical protein
MQLTESFDVKDEPIAHFATTGTTRARDGRVSRLDDFQSTTAAINNTHRITLAFHDSVARITCSSFATVLLN